jgi:hypothetical protein
MNRIHSIIITLFAIIITGCTSTPTMGDFTYSYSMENVNNFKIEFQLNPDASFKITQYNFFFDNFEKAKKPITTEGILNNEEFSSFKELLEQSNLEDMEDSYGYDAETTSESDIIYMIELKHDDKTKYISINASGANTFPEKFTELIAYTNAIISDKHKTE